MRKFAYEKALSILVYSEDLVRGHVVQLAQGDEIFVFRARYILLPVADVGLANADRFRNLPLRKPRLFAQFFEIFTEHHI